MVVVVLATLILGVMEYYHLEVEEYFLKGEEAEVVHFKVAEVAKIDSIAFVSPD